MHLYISTYMYIYRNQTLENQYQWQQRGLVEWLLQLLFFVHPSLYPYVISHPLHNILIRRRGAKVTILYFGHPKAGETGTHCDQPEHILVFNPSPLFKEDQTCPDLVQCCVFVWRESSIPKQSWPHLSRWTEYFCARWSGLYHAAIICWGSNLYLGMHSHQPKRRRSFHLSLTDKHSRTTDVMLSLGPHPCSGRRQRKAKQEGISSPRFWFWSSS